MDTEMIMGIAKDTVWTLIKMAGPMLITGAVIGITMSMIQTVTQLKDQSLTFIPKIVGVMSVLVFCTPFLLNTLITFTNRLYELAEKLGKGL